MEAVYAKLVPFFTRLYIYDVEGYSIRQLHEVLKGLEQQEQLSQNAQKIYNSLEAASKANVDKILRQKKERQSKGKTKESMFEEEREYEALKRNPFRKGQESIHESILESTILEINETMIDNKPAGKDFKEIEKKSGKIYNGQLLISLKLSDLTKAQQIITDFYINSRVRESSITFETLKELNLQSKNPSLMVDNRKQKFIISNKNTLGLLFLQKHNVIIQSNFRSEKSSFELIYTQ